MIEKVKKVEKVEKTNETNDKKIDYFQCVRNLLSAKLGCMMGSFKKVHQIKQWKSEVRKFKSVAKKGGQNE